MGKFSELSNNEILMEIKRLQIDHEAVKLRMLKDYDEMESLEKRFAEANDELLKRLKGEK